MIALLLVALALGVDNLAVSVGIGVSGVRGATRLRVAVIFGLFEAGMPVLGLAAGRTVAGDLGGAARWLGGGLLVAVGCYQLIEWMRKRCSSPGGAHQPPGPPPSRLLPVEPGPPAGPQETTGALRGSPDSSKLRSLTLAPPREATRRSSPAGTGRLLVSGLAMSIDNLVVGFALGAYHVSVVVAALVIGTVSVAMALAGLELGARLGAAFGERGELAGAIVLIAVAVVMATGVT